MFPKEFSTKKWLESKKEEDVLIRNKIAQAFRMSFHIAFEAFALGDDIPSISHQEFVAKINEVLETYYLGPPGIDWNKALLSNKKYLEKILKVDETNYMVHRMVLDKEKFYVNLNNVKLILAFFHEKRICKRNMGKSKS